MAAEETILRITLAIIVGTLAAIVYSLRILVLVERRMINIEKHLDSLVHKLVRQKSSGRTTAKKKTKKRR
jgi:hypothetical protein